MAKNKRTPAAPKGVVNPPKMNLPKINMITGRSPAESVVICYLHPGDLRGDFMKCAIALQRFDFAGPQRLINGGFIGAQAGANLAGPRNELVKLFLSGDQADWLLLLDSDMTFDQDIIEQLLEFADPEKAPIVGGLCFGYGPQGQILPTIYDITEVDGKPGVLQHLGYPEGMHQVTATGAACLLVHRSVFETMLAKGPEKRFSKVYPWFQETEIGDLRVSEDMTFCFRAGVLRIPIFINTTVKLGHLKKTTLDEEKYFEQYMLEELKKDDKLRDSSGTESPNGEGD